MMARPGPVSEKSYQFAVQLTRAMRGLQDANREYVLSRQCIRSGTSIGANAEEAGAGQTRKDFVAKMAIASKEARETHYWLRLLRDSEYLEKDKAKKLLEDCEELIRLLTAIVKTSQSGSN
jgi:four helix bundle protein